MLDEAVEARGDIGGVERTGTGIAIGVRLRGIRVRVALGLAVLVIVSRGTVSGRRRDGEYSLITNPYC